MSIYATLWTLKFPRYGDDHTGCDWIAVMAQGVPSHAPLLVLSGREYATPTFGELHARICNSLRGHRPKLVAESWGPDGRVRLIFDDGSARDVDGGAA